MDKILNYTKEESYYDIIGCGESADVDQITKEFRLKVKSCHPDKTKDKEAIQQYEKLLNAYKVLSDPSKRKDYDKWLNSGLCIPYKLWQETSRSSGHASIHFAKKRMGSLPIEDSQNKSSKEKVHRIEGFTNSSSSKTVVSSMKRPSSASSFSFGRRSKFKKYAI